MSKKIDPLPVRYEALQIQAHVEPLRVMLAMETDQGPIAVHMDRFAFDLFVGQATYAQRLVPLPNQPQ